MERIIKKLRLLKVLMLVMLFVAACSNSPEDVNINKPKPVKAVAVQQETYPVVLEYTGNVKAKEMVNHSFKLDGKVAQVYVEDGDRVKKGQALAALDTEDLSLAIEASKNNLEKAQGYFGHLSDTFNRMEELYHEGAITKQELDDISLQQNLAELDLHNAELDYQNKQKLLTDSRLLSDYDGYVLKVVCKEGELVAAGYPAVVIRGAEQVVSAGVASRDFPKVFIGMSASVTADDQAATGVISHISQVPDEASRTYEVEILMEDELPVGAFVTVALEVDQEQGILIPISAIMTKDDDYVYLVRSDDRIEKRLIQVGQIVGDRVSVEGLKVDEKLVVEGATQLEAGDPVRVIE